MTKRTFGRGAAALVSVLALAPALVAVPVVDTIKVVEALVPVLDEVRLAQENGDVSGPFEAHVNKLIDALAKVGLGDKTGNHPSRLSGGQQQRVAIARAIAGTPALLLADESTGNLDSQMSQGVMEILRELNQGGMTIIMVTHDKELAACAGRSVHIVDGQIVEVTAQAMQALCA